MHRKILRQRRPTRRIGIPKGMLHLITLDILTRKSMSGIELMDEIEYYTDWRPSPGSMYPLLSKLEEQGVIELIESDDPSLKRYALTQSGVNFIEERRKVEPTLKSRYHSIQKIYWKLFVGMDEPLFDSYSRLLIAFEKSYPLIKNNPELLGRIRTLLLDTAKEIEQVTRQLEKRG